MAYLGAAQGAFLYEVLISPGLRELGGLPGLVHSQQCEVVALGLEELGLFLVRLRLLLTGPVEDVLRAQHADDLHCSQCTAPSATSCYTIIALLIRKI